VSTINEPESHIRVGISGWNYKEWRGQFYPKGLAVKKWFAHYASTFDTVELNSTFYGLAAEKTFATWRQQAPPGFLYAVKASRTITHDQRLKDAGEPLRLFLARVRMLMGHLGPALYQLPPQLLLDLPRLRDFLAALATDCRHVLEFRHPSWYCNEVRELLAGSGVGFCIHDMTGSPSPVWATGPLAYLRLHGTGRVKYTGSYGAQRLAPWAEQLRKFADSGRDVFVYFNNTMKGEAIPDALLLRELLGQRQARQN
jgi:uncharacterized protein YecE (DUF72 family)